MLNTWLVQTCVANLLMSQIHPILIVPTCAAENFLPNRDLLTWNCARKHFETFLYRHHVEFWAWLPINHIWANKSPRISSRIRGNKDVLCEASQQFRIPTWRRRRVSFCRCSERFSVSDGNKSSKRNRQDSWARPFHCSRGDKERCSHSDGDST